MAEEKLLPLDSLELYTLRTCYSTNAVNSAILMNPTNYYTRTPAALDMDRINQERLLYIKGFGGGKGDYKSIDAYIKSNDSVPNPYIPPITLTKLSTGLTYVGSNSWYHNWGILHVAMQKVIAGTPADLTCASGICLAFAACNPQKDYYYQNFGGFPKSTSSQVINWSPEAFQNKVITLKPGIDFEPGSGFLTNSGLNKVQPIRNWKGAVWNYTKSGGSSGHIALVLGAEIIQEPTIQKWRCYLYTLEFNTTLGSKIDTVINNPNEFVKQNLAKPGVNYYMRTELSKNKNYILYNPKQGIIDYQWGEENSDERRGGKLAFRTRMFGGLNEGMTKTSIACTDMLSGGAWAPNGLTQDSTYLSIGNWKKNKFVFEV